MSQQESQKDDQVTEESGYFRNTVKLIVGLTFVFLGIVAVLRWWTDVMIMLKGSIGVMVILLGALVLSLAKD